MLQARHAVSFAGESPQLVGKPLIQKELSFRNRCNPVFRYYLRDWHEIRLDFQAHINHWILIKKIDDIEKLEGIGVFRTRLMLPGSGICLPGIGIFIHSDIPHKASKRIIQHEFGHYLDYRYGVDGDRKRLLGSHLLGFYGKIGLPSLLNLVWGINRIPAFAGDHRTFWAELRANRLASAHFGETLASDFAAFFPLS